ncbi:MAG: homocysteine S-methyltransferase family protein [Phycisphaerales bacterium]|nr:homocysteine S-methyltransferase family protein [Phycisphaerales bacterium]
MAMKLEPAEYRDEVAVADGGWSTILRERLHPLRDLPEGLCLRQPEAVQSLTREYVQAGARFITTNSFALNRLALQARGAREDVRALNREAARLARQAVRNSPVHVVGSMSSTGRILGVREAADSDVADALTEQARALAEGGVDAIVLETFFELAEAVLAVRVVKDAVRLPVIASMSFDSGPQRTRTLMGAEAGECAARLTEAGADMVGCNCGAGASEALPAVVAIRAATDRPLWVKPNVGLPLLEEGRPVYRESPEDFLAAMRPLIDAGANIVGGCCGAGPEHIRRLAAWVAAHRRD